MAISDSYLKSCLGRERDKVEEKADRDGLWVRISKKGAVTFFYRFRFLGNRLQQQFSPYFSSLQIALTETDPPVYSISAITNSGSKIVTQVYV